MHELHTSSTVIYMIHYYNILLHWNVHKGPKIRCALLTTVFLSSKQSTQGRPDYNATEKEILANYKDKRLVLFCVCGEAKCSVYCKVPYKESGTARAQKAQTLRWIWAKPFFFLRLILDHTTIITGQLHSVFTPSPMSPQTLWHCLSQGREKGNPVIVHFLS